MPKPPGEYVARSSLSLPRDLLRDLDAMVREKGYENRSLAIADMIRDSLVEHRRQYGDREIAGTVTLVYDHHKHDLQHLLTHIQHDFGHVIIATLHVHLDHDNCLEVIALRGKGELVKKLADALVGVKGIKHGKLTVTTSTTASATRRFWMDTLAN
jgi:CopG family transcriptional regulator, nickel-responsive regulator